MLAPKRARTAANCEAEETASTRTANAKKTLAEALAAETAAVGLGEAQVMEAKAAAHLKEGESEAQVLELKAAADAKGIHQKAEAMKLFNEAGKEHEEFKLRLDKEKTVELESIRVNEEIARHAQSTGLQPQQIASLIQQEGTGPALVGAPAATLGLLALATLGSVLIFLRVPKGRAGI